MLNISYLHLDRRSLRWKGIMWLPQGPIAEDTDTVSLACRPVKKTLIYQSGRQTCLLQASSLTWAGKDL